MRCNKLPTNCENDFSINCGKVTLVHSRLLYGGWWGGLTFFMWTLSTEAPNLHCTLPKQINKRGRGSRHLNTNPASAPLESKMRGHSFQPMIYLSYQSSSSMHGCFIGDIEKQICHIWSAILQWGGWGVGRKGIVNVRQKQRPLTYRKGK